MTLRRLIFPLVMVPVLFGCAHGRIVDGTFVSDDYRFSVALPGPPFERIPPRGALVAVSDPETGSSIAVSTSPAPPVGKDGREAALRFVAQDLFISIEKREYLVSEEATIDGVPAWRVKLKGVSEDVPLIFSAYVARFSGTIYDIVLWSRPADFDRASAVFAEMVESFRFIREPVK